MVDSPSPPTLKTFAQVFKPESSGTQRPDRALLERETEIRFSFSLESFVAKVAHVIEDTEENCNRLKRFCSRWTSFLLEALAALALDLNRISKMAEISIFWEPYIRLAVGLRLIEGGIASYFETWLLGRDLEDGEEERRKRYIVFLM